MKYQMISEKKELQKINFFQTFFLNLTDGYAKVRPSLPIKLNLKLLLGGDEDFDF